eukprot:10385500-Alexandrium_andersonii.AAC.1
MLAPRLVVRVREVAPLLGLPVWLRVVQGHTGLNVHRRIGAQKLSASLSTMRPSSNGSRNPSATRGARCSWSPAVGACAPGSPTRSSQNALSRRLR